MRHYCQAWVDNDIIEGRKAEMYTVGTYHWNPAGDSVELWTRDILPVGEILTKWCKIRWNTGLKDKNGVEIYGGDVVKYVIADGTWSEGVTVVFRHGMFSSVRGSLWGLCVRGGLLVEVIGNIYENPELVA